MKTPKSITITDGTAQYAEQGIYLHGFTNSGESFSLQTRQADIPGDPHAGRLFFDCQLVEFRSETEAQLVELLSNADFADSPPDSVEGAETYIAGPIRGVRALQGLRDEMVNYLNSQAYVDLATHGLKKVFDPLKPWLR